MKKLLAAVFVVMALGSCYNDKYDKLYPGTPGQGSCDTTVVSFSKDIMPILTANCNISGGCHDAVGSSVSGYDFTSFTQFSRVAATGLLQGDIKWLPGYNTMPKNAAKLSDCDINKIVRWVNLGAQNN